jgi:hypothetical protein
VDEWSFFGRAGQAVTLFANPGSASSPRPPSPFLGVIDVQLLGPSGNLLASGFSTAAGQVVSLSDVALPVDGGYRLRVKAAASQPNNGGNYLLSLFDATVISRRLVLGEPRHATSNRRTASIAGPSPPTPISMSSST